MTFRPNTSGGGGGTPEGTDGQVQYKVNATDFGGMQNLTTDGNNPQLSDSGQYEIIGLNDANNIFQLGSIYGIIIDSTDGNESSEVYFTARFFGLDSPVLRIGVDSNGFHNGFLSEAGLTMPADQKISSIDNAQTGVFDLLWLDTSDRLRLTDYFQITPGGPGYEYTDNGDGQTIDKIYTSEATDITTKTYDGLDDLSQKTTFVSELFQVFDNDNTDPKGYYKKEVTGVDFAGNAGFFGYEIQSSTIIFNSSVHIRGVDVIPDTTSVAGYLWSESAPGSDTYLLQQAAGATTPPDGEAGFAFGAVFANGVENLLLQNVGTSASCAFRPLQLGNSELTGPGAVPLTAGTCLLTTTGTDALTLADGVVTGQRITVIMVIDGGDGTLTPTTPLGFSTVTFDAVGESATFEWTGAAWAVVSAQGATVA